MAYAMPFNFYSTKRGITINGVVTSSQLDLTVDEDCETDSGYTIGATGALVSTTLPLTIQGGPMSISPGGKIASGTNGSLLKLTLTEPCKTGASISIGGSTEGNSYFSLSQEELGAISAASLNLISSKGAIAAKALTQSTQFGELTGDVTMIASTTITFAEETYWEGLVVKATNGITISSGVFTMERTLLLSLTAGNIVATSTSPNTISSHADIKIISDSESSKLIIQSPATITSKSGFEIDVAIDVTRKLSGDAIFMIYSDATLSCSKPVQFVGDMDGINQMHIEVASISSSDTCSFSVNDNTDKMNLIASCTGVNCGMDIGVFSDPMAWSLPNLANFICNGELRIGDDEFSQRIGQIRIKGLTYESGDNGIAIRAQHNNGIINFSMDASQFDNKLSIYSSSIYFGAEVLIKAMTEITLQGCSNHDLQLTSNGAIITDGSDIYLKTGHLDISTDADEMSSPDGSITLEAICVGSIGKSVSLGGDLEKSWVTNLDRTELQKISATTFAIYTTGDTELFGFDDIDLPGVAHLRLNVQTSERIVTFSANIETKQLTVHADGVIVSNEAIVATTTGDLSLSFASGDMKLDGRLQTYSTGISIEGSGTLYAQNDAVLIAKTTIHLQVIMSVLRKAQTEFHVYSEGVATFEKEISFTGGFDNARFRLEVMELVLIEDAAIAMDRSTDTLLIQRPCTTAQICKMYFGDYPSADDFHMTSTELKLLSTAGALALGDYLDETFISTIHINDVDLSSNEIGAMGITIAARKNKIGRLIFETQTSRFKDVVYLVASSGITLKKDVFFTQLSILHSKDDCILKDSWNEEGLKMTGAGKMLGYAGLTINLVKATISQTAVIEAKSTDSSYQHIEFIENCWRRDSIKLGHAPADLTVKDYQHWQRNELKVIRAKSITFKTFGMIEILGFDASSDIPNLQDLLTLESLSTSTDMAQVQFKDSSTSLKHLVVKSQYGISLQEDLVSHSQRTYFILEWQEAQDL
jgi:hypothetical protein